MSDNSKIEWTATLLPDGRVVPGATWNPVTGCTRVSPGCAHCYAMTFAERFRGTEGHYYENGFDVQLRPKMLEQPLTWRRGRRIFVNSMSDMFHVDVPTSYVDRVVGVMAACEALERGHTFLMLTKRADRMRDYFAELAEPAARARIVESAAPHLDDAARGRLETLRSGGWPLASLWLGVSVENQRMGRERIPLLLDTPARTRFLSCEPLLGPVDLSPWVGGADAGRGTLDWIIVGGESGHRARPMNLAWAESLMRQSRDAGIACFVKQLGAVPTVHPADVPRLVPAGTRLVGPSDEPRRLRLNDRKGGDIDEWAEVLKVREYPERGEHRAA